MIPLTILLFAAGSSSRMKGRDKLLERIGDETLLKRSARRAVATGLPVIALLPPLPTPRAAELDGLVGTRVMVPDASDGMSRSIAAGLGALPDSALGAMMVMADMPDLETGDLLTLASRFDALGGDTVVRAAGADGTPGSPALVPRRLFAALRSLDGLLRLKRSRRCRDSSRGDISTSPYLNEVAFVSAFEGGEFLKLL